MRVTELRFCDPAFDYLLSSSAVMLHVDGGTPPYERLEPRDAARMVDASAHRMLRELRALLAPLVPHGDVVRWSDDDVRRRVRAELGSISGRLSLLARARPPSIAVAIPRAPPPPPVEPPPVERSWIEIELVDGDGEPIPDVRFAVTLPDGGQRSGSLGWNGFARIEAGTASGTAQVIFRAPDVETSDAHRG